MGKEAVEVDDDDDDDDDDASATTNDDDDRADGSGDEECDADVEKSSPAMAGPAET